MDITIKQLAGVALLLGVSCVNASPYSSSSDGEPVCTADAFMNDNLCLDGVGAGVYGFDNTRLAAGSFSSGARTGSGNSSNDGTAYYGNSNMSGMAAGDHFFGLSFWGTFTATEFNGDVGIVGARAGNYNGDTKSFMFGADKFVTDRLIAGLAIGYEDTEVFTLFNGGNNDSDGVTVVPYAAYLINDVLSFDAAFGYSFLDYGTNRISTVNGSTITGGYDADRLFVSANLNASTMVNNFILSGRLGILYTEEEQDGYTESGTGARTVSERTIDLTQGIIGGEVAYASRFFEPYIGFTYANDLNRDTGGSGTLPGLPGGNAPSFRDKDEMRLNIGARFYRDEISASIDYVDVMNRSNFESHSFMLNLRVDI